MALQPIVDLERSAVAGWETLLRCPPRWHLAPDVLFAAARDAGLSGELELLALRAVMGLHERLPPNTFLTVNVDPDHLVEESVMAPLLAARSLSRLVVEVTEHEWTDDEAIVSMLARFRERGATIAADDVGAGYASLNQLMRLRPQVVKLDRALIAGLGVDVAAETMVRTMGELCGSLDAWVIAEGVENAAQLTTLARLGVPLAQGWLLGRPARGWPGVDDAGRVRDHAVMGSVGECVVSLVVPLPPTYRRDDAGRHWLGEGAVPCTTVAPSLSLTQAVSLAVSRPVEQRWDPLIVTAEHGEAMGLVPLEVLFAAAAAR